MVASEPGVQEALQWKQAPENYCDCFLCAHRCHIKPGGRGICGVRENRDGTLFSLVYGMLVAANVDPIEKKPLFHFLPGTQSMSVAMPGCNFRCDFCQNWSISQTKGARIPGKFTPAADLVAATKRRRCPSISYTYTEPTIFFEYARDCARLAQTQGIRNCFVTNGYQTPETVEEMAGLIDAANVDLKAFNDRFYHERCGGRLKPICESIRRMHELGIHVEVTTLLIPGFNDGEDELKQLTEFLSGVSMNIPWHVSRYHPDYKFDLAPITSPDGIFRALEIGKEAGLNYCYAGNLPAGEHENTRCHGCGATIIKRVGFAARIVGLKGSNCAGCGCKLPIIRSSEADEED